MIDFGSSPWSLARSAHPPRSGFMAFFFLSLCTLPWSSQGVVASDHGSLQLGQQVRFYWDKVPHRGTIEKLAPGEVLIHFQDSTDSFWVPKRNLLPEGEVPALATVKRIPNHPLRAGLALNREKILPGSRVTITLFGERQVGKVAQTTRSEILVEIQGGESYWVPLERIHEFQPPAPQAAPPLANGATPTAIPVTLPSPGSEPLKPPHPSMGKPVKVRGFSAGKVGVIQDEKNGEFKVFFPDIDETFWVRRDLIDGLPPENSGH